jgi:hypothetical protein
VVDANLVIRQFLLSQSEVTALLGTNQNGSVYCGYDLPEGFDPTLGPGIQIYRAGGHSHPEIKPLVEGRVIVRAWAGPEEALVASTLYGAINDVLHGTCGASVAAGTIVSAIEVTGPFEMTDPETGWIAVYAFYRILAVPGGIVSPPVFAGATLTYYSNQASPATLTQVGSSGTWTLSVAFTSSAMVFWNGSLLSPTIDYTTSGSSITFVRPPSPGDNLVVMQ